MLYCSIYEKARNDLFTSVNILLPNFFDLNDAKKTNILLYGDKSLTFVVNKQILLKTLDYFKETKRFSS